MLRKISRATRRWCAAAALSRYTTWQRTRPVTSVIIGVRTMAQLDDNLGALDVTIPPEILEQLDQASRLPDEYPGTFIDIFQMWLRGGQGVAG